MNVEAIIPKALTKGVSAGMTKGMAKVMASYKLPALKQTPNTKLQIENLAKEERILNKQLLYYKNQENFLAKADRLADKKVRENKLLGKLLGIEKNNITIKEKQLQKVSYKKDTLEGGIAKAEKNRARKWQEENMIPDEYKEGTIKNKIKGLNVKNFMGRDEGGKRAFFQTGADLEKKRASRAKEEAMAAEHMGADFKGQDTDAMWKQNQQLETKKQKIKRTKGGLAKRAAVGMFGFLGGNTQSKREDAKSKKGEVARDKKKTGWLKGLFTNSEEEKKEGGFFNWIKNNWGKILIGALLLMMNNKVWTMIVDGIKGIWNWVTSIDWNGIFTSIANGIGSIVDFIFGKKNDKGVREGGLLGKGGLIEGHGLGLAVAGLVGTLALLTAPLLVLKTALLSIPIAIGKMAWNAGKSLLGFGKKKPGGLDRKKNRSPEDQKARDKKAKDLKEQRANKDKTKTGKKGTDLAKKGGTPKPKIPPVSTGGSPGGKPGGKPKASMIDKTLKKFPKLAKAMPFLRKLPIVGKVFTAGTIAMALAGGAGKKELIPMIGGLFGGVGGGILGAALGGVLGLSGGPVALVTSILGGIGGAMMGDTLGTGIAQWLMGEKVDAFGWGFGWVNDILNGGKGPEEGGVQTPKGKAASGGSAPPPMSKNEFLQSEKYKGQMRDESGVVRGESTAGKQMAYDDYLKEQEDMGGVVAKSLPSIKKDIKKASNAWGSMKKRKRNDINKFLDSNPAGDLIIEQLSPAELKFLRRDKKNSGSASASQPASNVTATPVNMAESKQQLFNQMNGLKPEADSNAGMTVINNSPTTVNKQGNAQNDTTFYGKNTAQDGSSRFGDDIF